MFPRRLQLQRFPRLMAQEEVGSSLTSPEHKVKTLKRQVSQFRDYNSFCVSCKVIILTSNLSYLVPHCVIIDSPKSAYLDSNFLQELGNILTKCFIRGMVNYTLVIEVIS